LKWNSGIAKALAVRTFSDNHEMLLPLPFSRENFPALTMKRNGKKPLTREQLLQRIWIDPARCFGKPCIRGHGGFSFSVSPPLVHPLGGSSLLHVRVMRPTYSRVTE
jgi:hypothetical protein